MQVDESLVDLHLETVPGVGTLTAWGFADFQDQAFGGHADGSGMLELLVLGSLDQGSAN